MVQTAFLPASDDLLAQLGIAQRGNDCLHTVDVLRIALGQASGQVEAAEHLGKRTKALAEFILAHTDARTVAQRAFLGCAVFPSLCAGCLHTLGKAAISYSCLYASRVVACSVSGGSCPIARSVDAICISLACVCRPACPFVCYGSQWFYSHIAPFSAA